MNTVHEERPVTEVRLATSDQVFIYHMMNE